MTLSSRFVLCMAGAIVMTAGCTSLPSWTPKQIAARSSNAADALDSQLSLARLSERHGQADFATTVYKNVLKKDPGNQTAHHRLAVMAVRQSQFDAAEHHFQQALATDARSSDLLGDVGYFLYAQDRLAEAESTLREALDLDPQNERGHTNLGLVLGEQGRIDESLHQFRQVMGEAEARANLAYVFTLLGDMPKAEVEYHHALALNNELKPAAAALLELNHQRQIATSAVLALRDGEDPAHKIQRVSYIQRPRDPLTLVSDPQANSQRTADRRPAPQWGAEEGQAAPTHPAWRPADAAQDRVGETGRGDARSLSSPLAGEIQMPSVPEVTMPAAFNSWQPNDQAVPAGS